MTVIIPNESHGIDIIAEISSQIGVTKMGVKSPGIIARPEKKGQILFAVISITHSKLSSEINNICKVMKNIHPGSPPVLSIDELVSE